MKDNLVNELGDLVKDCISRQAAIDECNKRGAEHIGYAIAHLPSAQPEVLARGEGELSAQSEPCEDAVSRKAVEEMLKNGFPARGMWEIEGDVVKQTVCETLADALMDLERLPSAQPEIIRCKDCKHRDTEKGFCEGRGWPMQLVADDGFCDKGKRREE